MSKFKNRLKSLKRLRDIKVTMAKGDMADSVSKLDQIDSQMNQARQKVFESVEEMRHLDDIERVKLFSEISASQRGKICGDMQKREVLQAELEHKEAYVAFLNSELKAVEKYEEKMKDEHKKEQNKKDQASLDEMNSIAWSRKDRRTG